jgi:O-antigen/teichoic acid export membrane protein
VKITSSWELSYTKELMGYGTGSSLFNALNFLATKIDVTILPFFLKTWGNLPAHRLQFEAGLYERSAYVMGLPITVMGKLSDNVLFSGMSKIQDENDRLRKAMLQGTSIMSIIIMPLSVLVMIFSKEIISIFLGETYAEAHITLRILFAAVIFRTIARISDSLVRAKDAVFKATRIKLIYCLFMISAVAGFSFLGKNWVAIGISLATLIHLILNTSLSKKLVQFGWDDFIICLMPSLVISAIITGVSLIGKYTGVLLELDPYLTFVVTTVSAILVAFSIVFFYPRLLGGKKKNPLHILPEKIKNLPLVRNMFARLN